MKRLALPSILFLAGAACAAQPPLTPVAAAPPPSPPSPPAMAANAPGLGPSNNMGLNYDGTYAGVSAVNNSAGDTWTSGGLQPCVTQRAPTLTISHGRAQFPWQGYTLHGNVTPSIELMMTSSFGQTFEGSIDSQSQIAGQVSGYWTYDLTWQKQS